MAGDTPAFILASRRYTNIFSFFPVLFPVVLNLNVTQIHFASLTTVREKLGGE